MTSLNHFNNLCLVTLPSPSPSADPAKLQSKLEALKDMQKLCEFLSNSQSDENPSKNLLDNLCSGLETFLGFNSTSKGYNGSGIVYSDLDRLCDGVMGFLYQVLKDVSEKQPYSVGKETLKNLVSNEIYNNLCSGHEGFKTLFDKLPKEIAAYNSDVKKQNDDITAKINNLEMQLNTMNDKVSKVLENDAVSGTTKKSVQAVTYSEEHVEYAVINIRQYLRDCQYNADRFNEAFDLEQKLDMQTAVNDLNSKLRNDVLVATKAVKHETQRLEQLAQKEWDDYKYMKKTVRGTMDGLKKSVNDRIDVNVSELVNVLKTKVSDIKQILLDIQTNLADYITKLDAWIVAAKKVRGDADGKVDEIVKKLKGEGETAEGTKGGVKNAAEQLKQKADDLREKAYAAKMQITEKVKAALKAVYDMNEGLKKDLYKVREAIGEQAKEIQSSIASLYNVTTNQHGVSHTQKSTLSIMKYIEGEVRSIKGKIGERMRDPVMEEPNDSIYQSWQKIKKEVQGCVDGLTGDDGGNTSLTQIVAGIKAYVSGFGKGEFKPQVLEEWVKEILAKDESAMSSKIRQYIALNQGAGYLSYAGKRNAEAVKAAIQQTLPRFIGDALQSAALKSKLYDATLTDIGERFGEFTNQFEQELKRRDGSSTIEVASTKIETVLQVSGKTLTVKHNLEGAVEAICTSIIHNFKHIAAELKRFIDSCNLHPNLEGAIDTVKDVAKHFNDIKDDAIIGNTADYGYNIDEALKVVQPKIEHLHDQLREASQRGSNGTITAKLVDDAISDMNKVADKYIGKNPLPSGVGSDEKISALGEEGFNQYKQQVDQEKLEALNTFTLSDIESKNKLPHAIKDIHTEMEREDHLKTVVAKGNGAESNQFNDETFTTLNVNINRNLDAFCNNVTKLADGTQGGHPNGTDGIRQNLNTLVALLGDQPEVNVSNHEKVKGLEKTYNDLLTLLGVNLKNAIENVDECLKLADTKSNETIRLLKEHVNFETQKAQTTLTTHARRNYVTSVKQLLTAFADKVGQELAPLPGEIERDLTIGFKGLMKTLEDGSTNKDVNKKANINLLKNVFTTDPQSSEERKEAFKNLSDKFNNFYGALEHYVKDEIKNVNDDENKKKNPAGRGNKTYVDTFLGVGGALNDLMKHLKTEHRYDYKLHGLLDNLVTEISKVKPEDFSKPNTPTMDSVTRGLSQFVDELRKVYISAYDSQTFVGELTVNPRQVSEINGVYWTCDLTEEGRRGAKVFLSILEIMNYDLRYLQPLCNVNDGAWRDCKINEGYKNDVNPLGHFLTKCGFIVPSGDGKKQDGELQCSSYMTGDEIYRNLITETAAAKRNTHINSCVSDKLNNNVLAIIKCLMTHLDEFYRVCHYSTVSSTKQPTSVYDMLLWLSGLPHCSVYDDLSYNGIGDLFEKPEKESYDSDNIIISVQDNDAETEGDGLTLKVDDDEALDAYPANIKASKLRGVLTAVCGGSHSVLTAIIGHGHKNGIYACDFNTNPNKFAYPSDPSKCLDVLFEVSLRLQEQLYLLYTFCKGTKATMSWRECWYGRGVGGSSWKCNAMQCPEQIADQKAGQSADQKHTQTCNRNCNQTAECGLKSPLQSFLEDGLPGFMPHPYNKADCKMTCSLSNHRGIPCKTPMGFSDLSVMASHTSKGERIVEALRDFCGQSNKPLSQLCGLLLCLLNRPPQTLGDMFAFYYNFISNWGGKGRDHKSDAFNGAVNDAYFGALYEGFTINYVFGSNIHGEHHHKKGDLFGLVECYSRKGDRTPSGSCGPYMRPLSGDIRNTFASKHAGTYLSWIVYITETFYDLLKKLFEECNKCCGDDKPKCRTARCSRNCNFNGTTPSSSHADSCDSIVNCKFTRPTLYKYGFVHEDALMLADKPTKRTCKDFCSALRRVLSDKVNDDAPLAKLVFKTIPEFLFAIRTPFFWTTVALWSLSLFYLICVMVGRLDVLHIRSHLRIPSSHKITAQSLLAAAQVGRLAKISYLQP